MTDKKDTDTLPEEPTISEIVKKLNSVEQEDDEPIVKEIRRNLKDAKKRDTDDK